MSQERNPQKVQELWFTLARLDMQSRVLKYKVEAWNMDLDVNMLSECSATAKEPNDLLTVVHTVRMSTMEAREATRGMSKQILYIMHPVDSKMIEIKEFGMMKDQHIQKGFKAVKAQIKLSEFKDLMLLRQQVRDKVSHLHAKLSVGWDTQAMQEGRLQYMTGPEKKAIQEIIVKMAKLLSLVRVDVTARREAAESAEWEGSKHISTQCVNVSQR